MWRGQRPSQWCIECVSAAPGEYDPKSGRIRVRPPHLLIPQGTSIIVPRVFIVGVGAALAERLREDPALIHTLSPEELEEVVCDRLSAMGMEPKRTGATNRKDGGIDVLFWPKKPAPFPFLGAAQVKHHPGGKKRQGPGGVRDFAGVLAGHRHINAGLFITNTSFTADATWFASEKAPLVRLRGFDDIQRWLQGRFCDDEEWREIPKSIELCPGVIIPIRGEDES